MNKQKAIIVGSGFSGISAASFLARAGYEVIVLEKNSQTGGRARSFSEEGFTFDMGPSWYWMPDVFDRYFKEFGKEVEQYYTLERLSPSYNVVWSATENWEIPSALDELKAMLESYEEGAAKQLDLFLKDARYKYEVGMKKLVFNGSSSPIKHLSKEVITGAFKLQLFSSFRKHVKKYFSHPRILSLLEFPVLFLGATAKEIPALYSLMNYADISLGTWYPQGGMRKVIDGMEELAVELGVKFVTDSPVHGVKMAGDAVVEVETDLQSYACDVVLNTSDYHFFETNVLPSKFRSYSQAYWDRKVLAPSSLLFYLGIDKRIEKLKHHNLFFDEDMDVHSSEIYEDPKWPTAPLFYACVPSKTDDSIAPAGMENLFLLIPLAPDLKDDKALHDKYYNFMMEKLERYCGHSIADRVKVKRAYCLDDFKQDYNAFKGNAYGLSNVLTQTAFLRPSIKSKKIKNLYHAGQLTLPGPGVPPSLISGEIAALEIIKNYK